MLPRTIQLLDKISQDGRSTQELHTVAISLALTRYINIELISEDEVRQYAKRVVDSLVSIIPLSIGGIYQTLWQIHQYRRSVMEGYYTASTGGSDITWLFGMNYYMSRNVIDQLTDPEFIRVYRNYVSILKDIVLSEGE